jgi:hypothetical protein
MSHDTICTECFEEGELLQCSSCPRGYHSYCLAAHLREETFDCSKLGKKCTTRRKSIHKDEEEGSPVTDTKKAETKTAKAKAKTKTKTTKAQTKSRTKTKKKSSNKSEEEAKASGKPTSRAVRPTAPISTKPGDIVCYSGGKDGVVWVGLIADNDAEVAWMRKDQRNKAVGLVKQHGGAVFRLDIKAERQDLSAKPKEGLIFKLDGLTLEPRLEEKGSLLFDSSLWTKVLQADTQTGTAASTVEGNEGASVHNWKSEKAAVAPLKKKRGRRKETKGTKSDSDVDAGSIVSSKRQKPKTVGIFSGSSLPKPQSTSALIRSPASFFNAQAFPGGCSTPNASASTSRQVDVNEFLMQGFHNMSKKKEVSLSQTAMTIATPFFTPPKQTAPDMALPRSLESPTTVRTSTKGHKTVQIRSGVERLRGSMTGTVSNIVQFPTPRT